jgi:hypothetical protein
MWSIRVIVPESVVIVAITGHAAEGCRAIRAARFGGDSVAAFQFELKRTKSINFKSLMHKWLRPEFVSSTLPVFKKRRISINRGN